MKNDVIIPLVVLKELDDHKSGIFNEGVDLVYEGNSNRNIVDGVYKGEDYAQLIILLMKSSIHPWPNSAPYCRN